MYRIRFPTGEESVYRSSDELAASVASGIVGPRCEVFHNSGARWLPVDAHPEVKALLLKRSAPRPKLDLVPTPPPPPAPPPEVRAPQPVLTSRTSGPSSLPTAPTLVADPRQIVVGVSRASKLRAMLALAGGLALVAALGAAGRFAWYAGRTALGGQIEGMSPPEAWEDTAYFPSPAVVPGQAQLAGLDSAVSAFTARKPNGSPISLPGHALRYPEAYAEARGGLEESLGYLGARDLLIGRRFLTPDSARHSRRLVAAVGNVFRVYRGQEVLIEQANPPSRGRSLRESFQASEATRLMLADAESLFALVAGAEGRVASSAAGLRFTDSAGAVEYGKVRSELVGLIRTWRDSAAGPSLVTVPRVLQLLGPLPPPLSR